MSLVSTYVRAVDGKLYRNPVIRGDGWFLCFDDDDPPELVVEVGREAPGFTFFKRKRRGHRGGRCSQSSLNKTVEMRFKTADSYFGRLTAPIPVPAEHDGVATTEEIGQGVVYDPKPKKGKKKGS